MSETLISDTELVAGTTAPPDAPEAETGRTGGRRVLALFGPPTIFAGAVVGLMYVLHETVPEQKQILVPQPHRIVADSIGDSAIRTELWEGLINTSKVAFFGLLISMALGMFVAVLMSQARLMENAFFPWAVVLQTVPTLALVPLIGVWFGFGFQSRVIVAVLISLFPIITNTLFGLKSVDRDLHDLFTLHHAGRATRLWKLQFPAAMPATFTGFRIAAGLSVIGAIVGEFFFGRGEKGLGNLVDRYRGLVQIEELYATIILSSLLGIAVFFLFGWVSRAVVGKWYEPTGTGQT